MIDPDSLNAWYEDRLVGHLWRNPVGAIGFRYEPGWIESSGFPISCSLPLAPDDISSADSLAHRFFANLLRWQIFNVLAGNSDGHAKNLSLLYLPSGEIRLAPFYDLVCTRAIERIDPHLAFAVGGQRDPGVITVKHWDSLAAECDTGSRFLRRLLEETAASLLERLGKTRSLFEARYGNYPALQRIERIVKRQCKFVV